jgi:DNA uptake protein ComE-like DNA-binding protein
LHARVRRLPAGDLQYGCHALLASTLSLFCVTPLVAQVGVNKAVANFNTAKKKVFANLPHLSAETVAVIQKQRPFPSIAALHKVIGKGLSADQQKELYSKAFIPINLNTATKGELRLIPGMSRKMVHEFEEYRPYKSLAKFRRSIGIGCNRGPDQLPCPASSVRAIALGS